MGQTIDLRKIIWGIILTLAWICTFVFIPGNLVIDWMGDNSNLTPLRLVFNFIGLLVIFFYNLLYRSNSETTKLSWTVTLTMIWLSMILFFPFRASKEGGAMGFFALIGGLAVVVLWVRFFSDEIFTPKSSNGKA
ncbi:hypothetical protein EI42_04528 [Thermosporothrix hazakensis]|uniref:Uncharacterized protein n=2 Tax=Thermosporothrix TaxID=768650 RepID=A0A326U4W2_THEHA|nr:hypothetical protein [Thermosporothrix hazakensis]PZW24646.1 hypothetical protein EI42_04528 [Thermosporothrix hazakensis]BBH90369.1 hypothetical protein KTC_51200 [Thermosporothrix sp. COM3]GCE48405.1 hypothetical protein KTH_32740 [Thermosporothrix hazakensis]